MPQLPQSLKPWSETCCLIAASHHCARLVDSSKYLLLGIGRTQTVAYMRMFRFEILLAVGSQGGLRQAEASTCNGDIEGNIMPVASIAGCLHNNESNQSCCLALVDIGETSTDGSPMDLRKAMQAIRVLLRFSRYSNAK